MPQQPFTSTERAAMQAMRLLILGIGGPAAFAQMHGLSVRSAERMATLRKPPPLGIAATLLDMLDREDCLHAQYREAAEALRAFVADRQDKANG